MIVLHYCLTLLSYCPTLLSYTIVLLSYITVVHYCPTILLLLLGILLGTLVFYVLKCTDADFMHVPPRAGLSMIGRLVKAFCACRRVWLDVSDKAFKRCICIAASCYFVVPNRIAQPCCATGRTTMNLIFEPGVCPKES